MPGIGLTIVDPGHFHAALVMKEMHPQVSPTAHVFAPLGPDLTDFLARIARFDAGWRLEVHTGPDFLERMARERAGTVAIFSGRNRGKIQRIAAAVDAGLHVLADKPMIIRRADLPVLERVLAKAEARGLIVMDLMTGRLDPVNGVLCALHADPDVFGEQLAGTRAEPGVSMASVHCILKLVAGAPNPRPSWFFDVTEQGEALADVGTHLVDRIHGTLFPDQLLDPARDIRIDQVERWPTPLSLAQFRQVTGEPAWTATLPVRGDTLDYLCNVRLAYSVRGVRIGLDLRWDWDGQDSHGAIYRGSRARLELRHDAAHRTELYVGPSANIVRALEQRIAALQTTYPGVALDRQGNEWRVVIPDALRLGHDGNFIAFARTFLDHVEHRRPLPAWKRPNMLAKSFVCTVATA